MNDQIPPPLTAALMRGLVSRRTLMIGAAGVGVTALAACGSKGKSPTTGGTTATAKAAQDLSATEKLVNWSNWPEYIDVSEDGKTRPTLDAFTKKMGIKVNYTEDYNDNDEFYAKVRPLLAAGKDTGRDVWCSTDWMVARLIRQGYVQKLDMANIPNAKNLVSTLKDVEFDPGRVYSLPWQSGFAGIAYNMKATGGKKIETITQLLTDPALKGKVTLLTEMRDTVGLVLLEQGKDPANFTDADFDAAIAMIQKAKDAGQIKGFTGNDYTDGLTKGDIAACVAWTGDVVQLQFANKDVGYTLPEGLHPVVRQLRHPGPCEAQEERRGAHQLLLRPRGHGAGGGVRELHPTGPGHQGGSDQERSRDGRQPAHLPQPGRPLAGPRLPRSHGRRGDQVRAEVLRSHHGLMVETTSGDLRLVGLTKSFEAFTAVRALDLDIPQGSFFALLGPSGCGKTTTLRMIAGLEEPTAGQILIGDKDITGTKAYQRNVNTVFQSYALFPHMTVLDNIAFGLKRRGDKNATAKAKEALDLVQLGEVGRKKPSQLSGGMQQRVALARAIVNRPDVLLLDEPLGALDLKLRRQMQIELKRIQSEVGITFVHVTHDQEEAMTMADSIAVMNGGNLEQLGDPATLYEQPRSTFVANFLGQSNLLRASVEGEPAANGIVHVTSHGHKLEVEREHLPQGIRDIWLGVRPEKLRLGPQGGPNQLEGEVSDVSFTGVATQYLVRMPWGRELVVVQQNDGSARARVGEAVTISWAAEHGFALDASQAANAGVEEES